MFKPTYLYIKIHNKTGLKYFGKTIKKDPISYKGSGTYWSNHLKSHGQDISTEIVGYYEDKDECMSIAKNFSDTNDIVNSKEWANQIPETGIDGNARGDFKHSEETKKKLSILGLGRKHSEETKKKLSIIGKGRLRTEDSKLRMSNSSKGKLVSNEHRLNISRSLKGKLGNNLGTCWINNGVINKMIKKDIILDYLSSGWIKGKFK